MTVNPVDQPQPVATQSDPKPPTLSLRLDRGYQAFSINQFEKLQIVVELIGTLEHVTKQGLPLNVPEGSYPQIVLSQNGREVSRLALDRNKPTKHESSAHTSVKSDGTRRQEWSPSTMYWRDAFKTMTDQLPAGVYDVQAVYPESGAKPSVPIKGVTIERVTIEQAQAANNYKPGDGKVWITVGDEAEYGRRLATLHNRSGKDIMVTGYIDWNNPKAKPAEPMSLFVMKEFYRPDGFHGFGGFCGTGTGLITLEDGSDTRIYVHPHGDGFARFSINYRLGNAKQNEQGVAHSKVYRLGEAAE